MKNILILLIASGILFSYRYPDTDKSIATVDQREGIYIFICSKPKASYEYLGTIKKTVAWSGKPEEMLNSMVKKCKKEYPSAQAIIFTEESMSKADCIKFKE